MDDCATKQWQLTVRQSCNNIPCFPTCCKGAINVPTLSDDEKDLESGVLRSEQSSTLQWKRSSIQGSKRFIPQKKQEN